MKMKMKCIYCTEQQGDVLRNILNMFFSHLHLQDCVNDNEIFILGEPFPYIITSEFNTIRLSYPTCFKANLPVGK